MAAFPTMKLRGFQIHRLKMTGYARKKLFRSFILCCLIPILLVGLIGGALVIWQQRQQAVKNGNAVLDKAEASFYEIIEGFEQLTIDLSHLSWVQKMMRRQESFNRYELREFAGDLNVYKNSRNPLDFVCIYFPDKGTVVTSEGLMELGFFDGEAVSINGNAPTEWLRAHPLKNQQSSLFPLSLRVYSSETEGLLYVKPLSLNLGETESRAVVFLFSQQAQLNRAAAQPLTDSGSDICLFDDETGKLYFSARSHPASFYAPALERQESAFGWNGSHVLARTGSPENLHFLLFIPQNVFYSGLLSILVLVFSFLSVAVLFGLVLSYELSQANYQPLGNLITSLRKLPWTQQQENGDEYLYLQNAVTKMVEQNRAYSEKLTYTEEQVLIAGLLKLFSDIPITDDLYSQIAAHFPCPLYCCVSIQERVLDEPEMSEELIGDFEQMLQHFSIIFFQVNPCVSEYILNFAEEAQLKVLIEALLKNQENFSGVFFSFGGICSEVTSLGKSYKEMQTAGKYRRLHINTCVSLYQDTAKSGFYYYPISDEFQLVSYLHAGNEAKALTLLEQLYRYNLGLEAASRHGIRNFFCDLILTLTKVAKENDISLPLSLERYLDTGSGKPEELYTEVAEAIRQFCAKSLQDRRLLPESKRRQLLGFIDGHLCDPDLSLQFIADQFHISSSYVSQLFKESTGDNFVDYINFHRVERSKKLLLQTEQSISAVSESCGFLNDATYRRLFKKYTGYSPSTYRKERGEEGPCI